MFFFYHRLFCTSLCQQRVEDWIGPVPENEDTFMVSQIYYWENNHFRNAICYIPVKM